MYKFLLAALGFLALAACGSSGGGGNPAPPPMPVTPPAPPPPPPEPTFEERLADLAGHDPNPCRARTPGFEALGGWLVNDGRELGRSRVWVDDQGALTDESTHGATVWETFTDCAVRSTEDQYAQAEIRNAGQDDEYAVSTAPAKVREDGRDLIVSKSLAPPYQDVPFPDPVPLSRFYPERDGERDEQRVLQIEAAGNGSGKRTGYLQSSSFQGALEARDTALWIIVGGYVGEGDERAPASGSSICGAANPLCLFAPWRGSSATGTSQATPQVSAALDTVWAIWPDMDVLDLRNLAFDCAENMTAEGVSNTDRTYSYSNGRSFTSATNTTWGHGILSLTCLFTPNGGLQDPTTGDPISGGIFGPLAGPVTGAAIMGVDYTGRDFGHGFARPVARENHAMAATANLRSVQAISANHALGRGPAAVQGNLWQSATVRVDLTAAGNAVGTTARWRRGGWIVRGGLAIQPEGAGPLTGSRAFRAPTTVSAAITAAYGRALPHGLALHLQADHWRTLSGKGRSFWENVDLRESRIAAALVRRAGRHEFALRGLWRSGLAGSLDIRGRAWDLKSVAEVGIWVIWRRFR